MGILKNLLVVTWQMPHTPIDVFEKVVRERDSIRISQALVGISTCQRLILITYDESVGGDSSWIDAHLTISSENASEFYNYMQTFVGAEAFRYLVEVTSGLRSYVIGETQITHQVKKAYVNSRKAGNSKIMDDLFQDIFKVSSRIQSETQIPKGKVSVLSLIEGSIRDYVQDKQPKVAIIGTGEMAKKSEKLIRRILPEVPVDKYTDRDDLIAQGHFPKSAFSSKISDYSLVFIATPTIDLTQSMIEKNTGEACLYIDLTIPRTISSLSSGSVHSLITLERLQELSSKNLKIRETAVAEAMIIIDEYLQYRKKKDILRQHQDRIIHFRRKLLAVSDKKKQVILSSLGSKDIERKLDIAFNSFLHHAQEEFESLILEVSQW